VNKKWWAMALPCTPMNQLVLLVELVLVLVHPSHSWCRSLGWNPSWSGPPVVEQLSLTSVRVSWSGLLQQPECADNILVKHYRGFNSNEYGLSDPLVVQATSYVVHDLTPNTEYTFQVIAREEKGILGVDYNRGEKTTFTTSLENRSQGLEVKAEDPLKVDQEGEEAKELVPVYDSSQTPKYVKAGLPIELMVGLIIAVMTATIITIGFLYNCLRRKRPEKDLEINTSSDMDGDDEYEEEGEEDDQEEEEEEEEEEFEDNARDTRKYDMMAEQNRLQADRPKLMRPISVA